MGTIDAISIYLSFQNILIFLLTFLMGIFYKERNIYKRKYLNTKEQLRIEREINANSVNSTPAKNKKDIQEAGKALLDLVKEFYKGK